MVDFTKFDKSVDVTGGISSGQKQVKRKKKEQIVSGFRFDLPRTIDIREIQKDAKIKKRNLTRDKGRKALPPGKRISKSGNVYYEYRPNRADTPGKNI